MIKTTELIGISLIQYIKQIEKILDDSKTKVKYFKKEKEKLEALKHTRVAFIEILNMIKNAEQNEDKMLQKVFEQGKTDISWEDFWEAEFDRTQKIEEKQEDGKTTIPNRTGEATDFTGEKV